MADALWIVVPNWGRFQHYKDRNPTWIKLYLELAHRDDWRDLTLADRGLLVSIWIEYAASRGRLRTSDLPAVVTQKFPRRHLDSLVEAGLIQLSASAPSRERAREKRARERGTTYPQEEATPNATENGVVASSEKDESAEPLRDPEALTRIREIADQIGRP